jgi:hypothetical protein
MCVGGVRLVGRFSPTFSSSFSIWAGGQRCLPERGSHRFRSPQRLFLEYCSISNQLMFDEVIISLFIHRAIYVLFSVINIGILHYKFGRTSNNLSMYFYHLVRTQSLLEML